MGRTKEGGSVLGFVVVAIVLAALLLGGVYFVSQQGAMRPTTPASKPQEQPKKDEKSAPPPAEPGKKPESQTPQATPQAGVSHELPMTGPTESLSSLLILGLMSGVLGGYIRSRQARFSL